jgi:3-hydroxyisobutyrate dehydrogenase-like beta-hydroxyacid dehydrogenase
MVEKVGFIGLGNMGKPMAKHLVEKGFSVMVRDINPVPVKELVGLGAKEGKSPKEVAQKCTILITMLFNDPVVKEVALGSEGIMEGFQPGSLYVDMSTLSPLTGVLLAQEAEMRGGAFLSAPVTRGPKAAREGTLTIMVGGKKSAYDRCLSIFQAMGEKIFHVGERPEMGHIFKLVNNFLSATHGAIAAEAMAFGVKAGADPEKLFEVISAGSGNSYMFQVRVQNMLEGSPDVLTLPIQGLFKDLEAVTSYAKEIQIPLLFPNIAQQIHLEGMAQGIGLKDPSAFAELYEKRYNIRIRKEGK